MMTQRTGVVQMEIRHIITINITLVIVSLVNHVYCRQLVYLIICRLLFCATAQYLATRVPSSLEPT